MRKLSWKIEGKFNMSVLHINYAVKLRYNRVKVIVTHFCKILLCILSGECAGSSSRLASESQIFSNNYPSPLSQSLASLLLTFLVMPCHHFTFKDVQSHFSWTVSLHYTLDTCLKLRAGNNVSHSWTTVYAHDVRCSKDSVPVPLVF